MRQERVDLKSLVTDKLPLIQWEEGFRRARDSYCLYSYIHASST
ncbi:unnamed protein product, partial [marine sediment metagenome]